MGLGTEVGGLAGLAAGQPTRLWTSARSRGEWAELLPTTAEGKTAGALEVPRSIVQTYLLLNVGPEASHLTSQSLSFSISKMGLRILLSSYDGGDISI